MVNFKFISYKNILKFSSQIQIIESKHNVGLATYELLMNYKLKIKIKI